MIGKSVHNYKLTVVFGRCISIVWWCCKRKTGGAFMYGISSLWRQPTVFILWLDCLSDPCTWSRIVATRGWSFGHRDSPISFECTMGIRRTSRRANAMEIIMCLGCLKTSSRKGRTTWGPDDRRNLCWSCLKEKLEVWSKMIKDCSWSRLMSTSD